MGKKRQILGSQKSKTAVGKGRINDFFSDIGNPDINSGNAQIAALLVINTARIGNNDFACYRVIIRRRFYNSGAGGAGGFIPGTIRRRIVLGRGHVKAIEKYRPFREVFYIAVKTVNIQPVVFF